METPKVWLIQMCVCYVYAMCMLCVCYVFNTTPQLMILCNINTLPNSLPNRFSLPEPGHRDLTLQLDSKEWRPHFGVLSRLQNCLNTVLEFLALNYSHQDKGLKCEVIVRWTKEPAQRTVSLQLQLQQLQQLQHLEGQPTWWGGADYYYSIFFNLILYSVLKIDLIWILLND